MMNLLVLASLLYQATAITSVQANQEQSPLRSDDLKRQSTNGSGLSATPSIQGCSIFPANNVWDARVDGLPVHARSSQWINTIGRNTGFHMDFGSGTWDGGPIGIPYNVVDGSVTKVPVSFYYPTESDPGPYPIPSNPLIEYGSDHHILILDHSTCTLYEIYDASYSGGTWHAGSGAIWDLNSNALRPDTWTSADAAGLPILPGLVRYDEIASGEINHAIRFTAAQTNGYIWPARHLTSNDPSSPQIPPMGARFRLKASFDISGYPSEMQIILRAMKIYGIILADNGSNWYISGAPDERWDNDMLHLLDSLTGDDFEAVNTSALMVNPDSGATQPIPPDTTITAAPLNPSITTTATFGFTSTETGSTFECSLDGGPFSACSSPKTYTGLSLATHTFSVRATDTDGNSDPTPASYTWKIQAFLDVPNDYWAASFIQRLASAGITVGCGGGNYCPLASVTRDQMAIFLLRSIHGSTFAPPAMTGTKFRDVPQGFWAGSWIEQLALEGITAGCGNGNYCPGYAVNRDQMAVFLLRAKHGSSYVPPAATGVFQDVPTGYWAAAWIEQLALEGITSGCSVTPKLYCPASPVLRDQMAVFLVRAFNLQP